MLAVFVEMELSAVSSLPVAAVREPSAAVSLVYKPNVSGLLSSVVILLSFVMTCVSTLKCYCSTWRRSLEFTAISSVLAWTEVSRASTLSSVVWSILPFLLV